jgi:hypothetical protein
MTDAVAEEEYEEMDYTTVLGKSPTSLQARMAEWIRSEEVGYDPNAAKSKMEAFNEGVRIAVAHRMNYQASTHNKEATAIEREERAAEKARATAEREAAKAAKAAERETAAAAAPVEETPAAKPAKATRPAKATKAAKAAPATPATAPPATRAPARRAPARRAPAAAASTPADAPF